MLIHYWYECFDCGTPWESDRETMDNERCPECQLECSPVQSNRPSISTDDDETDSYDARWRLRRAEARHRLVLSRGPPRRRSSSPT
jgi:hypothetical protein